MVAALVRRQRTSRVQVFRTATRRGIRVRYFPPVPYMLFDGTGGVLRRAVWVTAGRYEIRVVL